MKQEYVSMKWSAGRLALVEIANDIIDEYEQIRLTLTLRQLFYQFVARDHLENTQRAYKRLGDIIGNARLCGLVDWDAIEDRTRALDAPSQWDDPADIIKACARSYNIDRWIGQDHRVEVWVEKQALFQVVKNAAREYDVPAFACRGYTSLSEMKVAADRLAGYRDDGHEPVIIHLGDHDPSGIDMTRDITVRLNEVFGVEVTVNRIALNMEQVRKHKPPPNPAKMTDSRASGYVDRFGDKSWELDALDPRTLRDLIVGAIEEVIDVDLYQERVDTLETERGLLRTVSTNWPKIAKKYGA